MLLTYIYVQLSSCCLFASLAWTRFDVQCLKDTDKNSFPKAFIYEAASPSGSSWLFFCFPLFISSPFGVFKFKFSSLGVFLIPTEVEQLTMCLSRAWLNWKSLFSF